MVNMGHRHKENGQEQAEPKLSESGKDIEARESQQVYPGITLLDERDRQRQQLWRELQELDRTIAASDGYRIQNKMSLLKKSYFAFDTNYLSLKQALTEFEQPMVFLKLWQEKNQNRLELFMNDIIRLFNNFAVGTAALLNHVRTVHNAVNQGTSFSEEYRTRQEHVTNAPLPHFVEDLLDYMLHKELPFALAELNFSNPGSGVEVNSAVKLDVGELSKGEQWSEKAREYLDTLDHKVKLYDIVNEYRTIVADFYQWFVMQQSELHREALEELEELASTRRQLQQKVMHLEDLLETAEQTTITVREEQEKLAKELEAERQRREREEARADRLEAEVEKAGHRWWRRG